MSKDRVWRFPTFVLGWNILVILWGAFVRATGSGAGCGDHWPLCNGAVVPPSPTLTTLIEYGHRTTSGLALIFVFVLVWGAFRRFPRGAMMRKAAVVSLILILVEALIGAGLVLFELVDQNSSVSRAVSISIHFVNTLLLVASLVLTTFASNDPNGRLRFAWASAPQKVKTLFLLSFCGFFLIGMSGAITALGDTLFPAASVAEGFRQDFSSASHFLIRLRIFHPILAVLVGGIVFAFADTTQASWGRTLKAFVAVGWGIGVTNWLLLAPVPMQMVHLLMADLIWMGLIWGACHTFLKLESV